MPGIHTILSSSAPSPDIECYRPEIENLNLTREQETELLQILYRIMSTFVEIGFGVDSVQHCLSDLFDQSQEDVVNNIDNAGQQMPAIFNAQAQSETGDTHSWSE